MSLVVEFHFFLLLLENVCVCVCVWILWLQATTVCASFCAAEERRVLGSDFVPSLVGAMNGMRIVDV
jgi:hypothetical protein